MFDACVDGQQLNCLTVIDEFTRECLAINVAGSIRSGRVIEVLSKLVSVHGAPKYRPCSSLDDLTRIEFKKTQATTIPTMAIS